MRCATVLSFLAFAAFAALAACAPRPTTAPPAAPAPLVVAPVPPPPPPVLVAGAPAVGHPLGPGSGEPADRATFLAFLPRYLRFTNAGRFSPERLDEIIEGEGEYSVNHDLIDDVYLFSNVTLYVADVNNDGTTDYMLVERNSVGMHNDTILGVYDEDGPNNLTELALSDPTPAEDSDMPFLNNRGDPFIEFTAQGAVLHFRHTWFVDAAGDGVPAWADHPADRRIEERSTLFWKGDTVRELSHTKTATKL